MYVNHVGVYWKSNPHGFDFIKYKSNKYSTSEPPLQSFINYRRSWGAMLDIQQLLASFPN